MNEFNNAVKRVMSPFIAEMRLMIETGSITGLEDDDKQQRVQVTDPSERAEDGVVHMQPYGLSASPPMQSRGIVFSLNGRSEDRVMLAASPNNRPSVDSGEVRFYSTHEQQLYFGADGSADLSVSDREAWLTLTTGAAVAAGTSGGAELKLDGDSAVLVHGGGNVKLGTTSASRPVARKDEPVAALAAMITWATTVETAINALAPGTFTPATAFSALVANAMAKVSTGSDKVLVP